MLASVDAQATRISKQLEKLDFTQKEECRRRSLTNTSHAGILAELANSMTELRLLHKFLRTHKV